MHRHAVLFVDDEINILKAVKRLLRNESWEVLCAGRPQEALELLDTAAVQVVVSDQRMPEMSGVDLLAAVRERHPDVVRMMLTGYTEMNVAVEAINRGEIFRLITKPWNDEELKATLRQAFDHFDLKEEIKRLNQVTREQNFKLQDMNRNLEYKVRERTKQLAEKHHELRTAYIQTIRALAEAVDAKDAYTRGHSERVGVYASKIAREVGLPRELIERVYIAGLLHDVGKIGIRDYVITKPDRLTAEEYEEIKRHPEIGAKILEPVSFLADVVECVRHHHEWYDGSERGYPDRLRARPHPAALAHHPRRRHRRGDDQRPALPRAACPSRWWCGSCTSTRAASSTPPASTPACGCWTAKPRTSSRRTRSSTSTRSSRSDGWTRACVSSASVSTSRAACSTSRAS